MEKIMSDKKPTSKKDLTNKLIIENLKVITSDMRMVKHAIFKMMKDLDYCLTQGDVITEILEEARIAGKDEIPLIVDEVIKERDNKVKGLFEDILEQVENISDEDKQLKELKKLLKDSPQTGEA
tara:strand:- start:1437 stop:1808 length:372 start_codon:yes stop_codon:yes gene_type:complete